MTEKPKPYQVVYDYTDAPTLKKFALSSKRVRCVMGPFASGKSSAMVMEIIRRAHEQKPSRDGIRRTRWAVVRNCFDDQTEALTETNGWKLFSQLLPEEKIASLINDNELVFEVPTLHYSAPYKGEMIGYKNRNLDFLVTPDHRLYASKINGRTKEMYGYKFHIASDIYGMSHYRFRKTAENYNYGETQYSEKMFEFFGFWFAEGYAGKYPRTDTSGYNWRLTVTQKDNVEYVTNLLNDCGLTHNRNKGGGAAYNYVINLNDNVKSLIEKLSICGKAATKFIPTWIKCAPKKHIQSFLYGYEQGDGHSRTHKNDSTRLYTASERMADDLQELIAKVGGSASINKNYSKPRAGSFKNQGFMFLLTIHQPSQYKPASDRKSKWYKQQYDGIVYCLEVPSHVILTRRNKIISYSSQSYRQLADTTIKTFHDWFPPKLFGEYRVTDHTYIITKFPGIHLEVMFRALDRPDQISNLLSLELTGAWFNEVREIPKDIIVAMDGRINRYPSLRDGGPSWTGMIMDTNPPDDQSFLYDQFETVRPKNWQMFKQPSGLSPYAENTTHLSKNYYTDLADGKDEMYVRVYIHGQYGYLLTGKPVFQSFMDSVHVALNPLTPFKGIDVIAGFDFGLNPSVLFGQVTPSGQLRILDELVSNGMGLRQFCENQLIPLIRRKYFGMNIVGFGDPAGVSRAPTDESTCFEILHSRDVGLNGIDPAPTNALVPRIGAVEFFLNKMYKGEPSFLLDPRVKYLRKAMNGAYCYKKEPKSVGGEEYKAVPEKGFYSHISDALQYLCMYVSEKEERDKKYREVMASLNQKRYSPASSIAGY